MQNNLKILQIGAGSMGSRRLRDLSTLPDVRLGVLDLREDRRLRAGAVHRAELFDTITRALDWKPNAVVISTPPDQHSQYLEEAIKNDLHHFVEADVVIENGSSIDAEAAKRGIISAPSFSLYFVPIIRRLKALLPSIGTLHSYQAFLSTYLPDWHPYERGQFYAYKKETAAAREMVPFELSWLEYLFGGTESVSASIGRRGELDADADDCYSLQLKTANGVSGQLTVLMGSESVLRKVTCAGTKGLLECDILSGNISVHSRNSEKIQKIDCGKLKAVMEMAYRDEIRHFVDAIRGKNAWPLKFGRAAKTTGVLAAAELSSKTFSVEKVDSNRQPSLALP